MPTVLRIGPYRFFFYSGDGAEPPHIHVESGDCLAKYWLDPVRLERSRGYKRHELNSIETMVVENRENFLQAWHEYFNR